MEPAAKKPKQFTSTPATVVSISSDESDASAAGTEVKMAKEQVNKMLRDLRDSDTIDQAINAMDTVSAAIQRKNCDGERCNKVAKMIVSLDGVGTIHSALKDWHEQSEEFSETAIRCLISLTHLVKKLRTTIARIGGIKTILSIAKKHEENFIVRSRAVALLYYISHMHDNEMEEGVAADECTDLVLETMKKWPDDAYTHGAGCEYFHRIAELHNIKTKLRRDGICVVLANGIKFFGSDDILEENAYKASKKALNTYMA